MDTGLGGRKASMAPEPTENRNIPSPVPMLGCRQEDSHFFPKEKRGSLDTSMEATFPSHDRLLGPEETNHG